ncbi:MAG: hypothetical protein MJ252_10415 [archaeon]|nr:hypothetical protein [archaeon]
MKKKNMAEVLFFGDYNTSILNTRDLRKYEENYERYSAVAKGNKKLEAAIKESDDYLRDFRLITTVHGETVEVRKLTPEQLKENNIEIKTENDKKYYYINNPINQDSIINMENGENNPQKEDPSQEKFLSKKTSRTAKVTKKKQNLSGSQIIPKAKENPSKASAPKTPKGKQPKSPQVFEILHEMEMQNNPLENNPMEVVNIPQEIRPVTEERKEEAEANIPPNNILPAEEGNSLEVVIENNPDSDHAEIHQVREQPVIPQLVEEHHEIPNEEPKIQKESESQLISNLCDENAELLIYERSNGDESKTYENYISLEQDEKLISQIEKYFGYIYNLMNSNDQQRLREQTDFLKCLYDFFFEYNFVRVIDYLKKTKITLYFKEFKEYFKNNNQMDFYQKTQDLYTKFMKEVIKEFHDTAS